MLYFIDTEFDQEDLSREVELISLALVAENGSEFYAINKEYDQNRASPWLKEHVLPVLWSVNDYGMGPGDDISFGGIFCTRDEMRAHAAEFLVRDPEPVFWGYYADYDWYLFTRLWGFMNMPEEFPKLCMELRQWEMHLGCPQFGRPEPLTPEHNALADARWNKQLYEYIKLGKGLP